MRSSAGFALAEAGPLAFAPTTRLPTATATGTTGVSNFEAQVAEVVKAVPTDVADNFQSSTNMHAMVMKYGEEFVVFRGGEHIGTQAARTRFALQQSQVLRAASPSPHKATILNKAASAAAKRQLTNGWRRF